MKPMDLGFVIQTIKCSKETECLNGNEVTQSLWLDLTCSTKARKKNKTAFQWKGICQFETKNI